MVRGLTILGAAVTLLIASLNCFAGMAIVVHPSNTNSMDMDVITKIYLGKRSTFPDGSKAIPIDFEQGAELRAEFAKNVLGKSEPQLKSYWSQLLFSGKGVPPRQVRTPDEVKALVSQNPNLLGYLPSDEVDETVKVVLEIQ